MPWFLQKIAEAEEDLEKKNRDLALSGAVGQAWRIRRAREEMAAKARRTSRLTSGNTDEKQQTTERQDQGEGESKRKQVPVLPAKSKDTQRVHEEAVASHTASKETTSVTGNDREQPESLVSVICWSQKL